MHRERLGHPRFAQRADQRDLRLSAHDHHLPHKVVESPRRINALDVVRDDDALGPLPLQRVQALARADYVALLELRQLAARRLGLRLGLPGDDLLQKVENLGVQLRREQLER